MMCPSILMDDTSFYLNEQLLVRIGRTTLIGGRA